VIGSVVQVKGYASILRHFDKLSARRLSASKLSADKLSADKLNAGKINAGRPF